MPSSKPTLSSLPRLKAKGPAEIFETVYRDVVMNCTINFPSSKTAALLWMTIKGRKAFKCDWRTCKKNREYGSWQLCFPKSPDFCCSMKQSQKLSDIGLRNEPKQLTEQHKLNRVQIFWSATNMKARIFSTSLLLKIKFAFTTTIHLKLKESQLWHLFTTRQQIRNQNFSPTSHCIRVWDHLAQKESINETKYCEILKKLKWAIQNKTRACLQKEPTYCTTISDLIQRTSQRNSWRSWRMTFSRQASKNLSLASPTSSKGMGSMLKNIYR